MEESTHIVFDDTRIVISPNLLPIFDFLIKIENEVKGLLGVRHQLESARKGIKGTLKLLMYLLEKYPDEKKLKMEDFFDEDPRVLGEKLNYVQITRSEMIVLFANLETVMALNAVYELNTIDETIIRNKLMDKKYVKSFINDYILNIKNPFYRNNIGHLKFVSNSSLRDLRNSLSHFFSVRGLTLVDETLEEMGRKVESKLKNKVTCISPREMNELLNGACKMLLIKWNNDFTSHSDRFKERITKVNDVVKRDGAILIYAKDLNI